MKKDDRNNIRRERFIMMSTSALVLTALTVTGFYMKNRTQRAQDNGYTIDFSALENRADDKLRDIAKSSDRDKKKDLELPELNLPELNLALGSESSADQSGSKTMSDGADLISKNTPQSTVTPGQKSNGRTENAATPGQKSNDKTGSATETVRTTENAGRTAETGNVKKQSADLERMSNPEQAGNATGAGNASQTGNVTGAVDGNQASEPGQTFVETAGESPLLTEDLHFSAENLQKPIGGAPVIDYSMDHSVYFATLDQYKYNPAVIYGATLGEAVRACHRGRVMNVHNDAELGHVLVMDLGDGYQAIYGQLENISVPIGATVDAGMQLATVAAPTKYFSKEGNNLYFQLKKDGQSIDPGEYFQ